AGVDAPFQRNGAAGMMKNVAVEIEHEDVVRLYRRLVGAAAGTEQYPIGARHAHGHMPEYPDRALQVEHPGQGRGLAPPRRLIAHERCIAFRRDCLTVVPACPETTTE